MGRLKLRLLAIGAVVALAAATSAAPAGAANSDVAALQVAMIGVRRSAPPGGGAWFAGWNSGGYGNLIVIKHRLGWETWYARLSGIAVSVGQAVAGGTVIGYVGSTGRSTDPHLHFETRYFGTPVDPAPRLLMAASAGGRRLKCRPNADARRTRNTDPYRARFGRCP